MDLFKVEGDLVIPTEHALLIPPYSTIWEQDLDPKKANAIKAFKYIEFNCSPKRSNPFKGFPDEVRKNKIIEHVFKQEAGSFQETELIVEGMKLYEILRMEASVTLQYYLAVKEGAEKLIKWFRDLDMTAVNTRSGMPLYKPREITSALKDSYDVMKTLNTMEEKVHEQIFESTKTRRNRQINYFER